MNVPCASSITVDGNISEANWNGPWQVVSQVDVANVPVTITAQWKARWDATYLYLAIDVYDTTPFADSGATVWDDDAVEIYVDMNHTKAGAYDANGEQFVLDYNLSNSVATKNAAHLTGVLKAVQEKAGNAGYTMEVAIPWANFGKTAAAGNVYGVDVAVDSDYNGGTRDGQIVTFGNANDWTNMSAFGDLTLLSCAATPTPTYTPMSCQTPSCATGWTIIGSGSTIPTGVLLTNDVMWQATAMWANFKMDLTQNFDDQFDLYFGSKSGAGADGIVFVLQNDLRGLAALGDNGQGLSYGGVQGPQEAIQPSLDIEWDTYQNNGGGDPLNFHDPSNHHTSIHVNGDADESDALLPAVDANGSGTPIDDGNWHRVRITWNATTHVLSTYFDGVLRQSTTIDLINTVFHGVSCVYWGFTSGTGGQSNLQEAKEVDCYSPTPTVTATPTTVVGTPSFTPTKTTVVTATNSPSPAPTASGGCASQPTVVKSGSLFSGNPGGGISVSYNDPGGSNTLLLVRLETNSSTVPSAITYDGVGLTKTTQNVPQDGGLMQTWYMINPPVGSFTLAVTSADTFSGNSYNVAAVLYAGADQVNPIGNVSFAKISSAAVTWTNGLTTNGTNSTIDQYLETGSLSSYAPGAGQTNLNEAGGCCNSVEGSYYPVGASGSLYNLTATFDSAKTGSSDEVEIHAVACPPTPTSTISPSATRTATASPTRTITPSVTPSATPSRTPTYSQTATLSATPTTVPTKTPSMPIVKTSSLGSATLGDTLTFCASWTNDSSATQTIVAWDTVSSYITYQSCNGGCSKTGSLVTWSNSVASGGNGQGCFWGVVSAYPP